MRRIIHLTKIWFLMAKIAAQSQLVDSAGGTLFIIGKIVRFIFYFLFLFSVLSSSGRLAGYSREEVIWFFLVFNLVDISVQFLFRGVYVFRPLIVSGNYDLDLLKPLPSFFRPLFGWTDILDFITLVPLSAFIVWFIFHYQLVSNPWQIIAFLALFFAALILAFAFHLVVSAVCILTTEIDHLVWVYRDLTAMARFPTDIYRGTVRFVLTFVFPVVLLITFPAKALLGLLSPEKIVFAVGLSLFLAYLALKFWYWGLRRYTSASS